jgi:DNA gyrase/topoisomerase IV subunit B
MNFFGRYWPELFDQGRIYRVLTPLVVAKRGKEVISFYTKDEYQHWESKNVIKHWDVEYKKGLAALEDDEYQEIISNPRVVQINRDSLYKDSLHTWFGGNSELRKKKLLC